MIRWFKHPTNSASTDATIAELVEQYGISAYARIFILREIIIGSMNNLMDEPYAEYSTKKWAEFLKSKSGSTITFLRSLEDIGEIKLEFINNRIGVTYPKLSKLLNDRAISSSKRRPNRGPRIEAETDEKKEKEEDISSPNYSSFWSAVDRVLYGQKTKEELPRIVFSRWCNDGFDNKLQIELIERLHSYFFSPVSSSKQKVFGSHIINDIKNIGEMMKIHSATAYPENSGEKLLSSVFENRGLEISDDVKYQKIRDNLKAYNYSFDDLMYIKLRQTHLFGEPKQWLLRYEDKLINKGVH